MTKAIEFSLDENITIDKFWKLADELFYTKVFYDANTQTYFTKHYKKTNNSNSDDSITSVGDDEQAPTEGKHFGDKNNDDGSTNDSNNKILENGEKENSLFEFDLDSCTEEDINTLLVSYITLVSNYCDALSSEVGEYEFFDSIAGYVLQFKYYQMHVEFCIRKMLSLLKYTVKSNLNNLKLDVNAIDLDVKEQVNESILVNEKLIKIIGWIFYKHYENYREELLGTIKQYCGFTTLCDVLKNYCAITKTVKDSISDSDPYGQSYLHYLELLFDLCKDYEFGDDELKELDIGTIKFIFQKLKVESRSENELNFLRFRLLLVFNEQFMFICGLKISNKGVQNIIFETMVNEIKFFQTFSEILILNFNREIDPIDQILMMKFLYLVFTNDETNQLLYLNDLKIIVDIIIRQLYNVSPSKYEYLINIYIRVLYSILTKTALKDESYKIDGLTEVLDYLHTAEQCSDATKNLCIKCLDIDYFAVKSEGKEEEEEEEGEKEGERNPPTNQLPPIPQEKQVQLLPSLSCPNLNSNVHNHHLAKSPTGNHLISPHRNHHLQISMGHSQFKELNGSMSSLNSTKSIPPPPPPSRNCESNNSLASINSTPPPPPPIRRFLSETKCEVKKDVLIAPPPIPASRTRHGSFDSTSSTSYPSSPNSLNLNSTNAALSFAPPPPPQPRQSARRSSSQSSSASEVEPFVPATPSDLEEVMGPLNRFETKSSICSSLSNDSGVVTSRIGTRFKKPPPPPPPVGMTRRKIFQDNL